MDDSPGLRTPRVAQRFRSLGTERRLDEEGAERALGRFVRAVARSSVASFGGRGRGHVVVRHARRRQVGPGAVWRLVPRVLDRDVRCTRWCRSHLEYAKALHNPPAKPLSQPLSIAKGVERMNSNSGRFRGGWIAQRLDGATASAFELLIHELAQHRRVLEHARPGPRKGQQSWPFPGKIQSLGRARSNNILSQQPATGFIRRRGATCAKRLPRHAVQEKKTATDSRAADAQDGMMPPMMNNLLQKRQLFHNNGRNGRETKANCTKQEAPPGGYKRQTITTFINVYFRNFKFRNFIGGSGAHDNVLSEGWPTDTHERPTKRVHRTRRSRHWVGKEPRRMCQSRESALSSGFVVRASPV